MSLHPHTGSNSVVHISAGTAQTPSRSMPQTLFTLMSQIWPGSQVSPAIPPQLCPILSASSEIDDKLLLPLPSPPVPSQPLNTGTRETQKTESNTNAPRVIRTSILDISFAVSRGNWLRSPAQSHEPARTARTGNAFSLSPKIMPLPLMKLPAHAKLRLEALPDADQ